MNIRTFAHLAIAAAFPFLAMATKVVTDRNFGGFGITIEDAQQTEFFTWFHLEETGSDDLGGCRKVVRFQPSGPKFHDLVTLAVETNDGDIQSATLHISRSFIDGPDEAFARDIAASFLHTALFPIDRAQANDLLLQIKNDYRGHRVVFRADDDLKVPQPPTPEYLVFLGKGTEADKSLKHMDLHFINTLSGGEQLLIRVDLTNPDRHASPCGSGRRK